MTNLPKSKWSELRSFARIAWKRIVVRDMESTQDQMEQLHREKDITDEHFQKICDFERKQSDWYFQAFAGACPLRGVFDAYREGILSDSDFESASKELIAARQQYLESVDPTSLARMEVRLLDSLEAESRSLYID